jgi:hypothetical protein
MPHRLHAPAPLQAITALMFLLAVAGCASPRWQVDSWHPDASYERFEQEMAGKEVRVDLGDGSTHRGRNLRIDAETTSWTDPSSGTQAHVPTDDVWRLQTRSSGKGAGSGFLKGLLIGGGVGALAGASSGGDGALDAGSSAAAGAIALGLVGGIVGAIAGGSAGGTTTYEIHPELAPPTAAEQEAASLDEDLN